MHVLNLFNDAGLEPFGLVGVLCLGYLPPYHGEC